MSSIAERLRGFGLGAEARPAEPQPRRGGSIPGRVEKLAHGAVHVADWSARRGQTHGRVPLDLAEHRRAAVAAAAARDGRFRDLDPASWLFIDTETTSLNSGAGVWVFMVGLGWFEGDEFRVRQFLLTDPGDERALLATVRARIEAAGAIVSFHGKSFDAPRLDDRFRLMGLAAALTGRPHFDLLHPVRRLFGHGMADCRLRTVEEELLGFQRVDDLPGALCPGAYFDWLRGRGNRLADVFEHNRLDVLSLAALAGSLAAAYDGGVARTASIRAGLDWAEAGEASLAARFLLASVDERVPVPVSVGLQGARWLGRLGRVAEARRLLVLLGERHPADPRPALALKRLERRNRTRVASEPRLVPARQVVAREASIEA